MLGRKELNELELRRQALVLQSNINRLVLRVELQNVQTALRPAEQVVASVRSARPWLLLLAPLVGIFAARNLRGEGATVSKALRILKWIPALYSLWKQFVSPSPESTAEPKPRP